MAEKHGMRAGGQAGFRQGRGTADNSFVLDHIICKYRVQHKPVYTAFVDFRKAYDCVQRPVLWKCLESLGVHGHFLDSLKSMYAQVKLQVRSGGAVGMPFESHQGVKQGDPLSPLLFGLLIDRVEAFIEQQLPTVGVHLRDKLIKVLLYADDLVLLAESARDLQLMLTVLHTFSECTGMVVNTKKSEVVVFNNSHCCRSGKVAI